MYKRDCFAFNPFTHQCAVLTQCVCESKDNCKFYKTKEQFKIDAAPGKRRLMQLGKEGKVKI